MVTAYAASDATRFMINLSSFWLHLTAQQMENVSVFTQPFLDASLGYFDQNPISVEMTGFRKMAALNPAFAPVAAGFPDRIILQYGLGENKQGPITPDAKRDFDTVRLILSAAHPERNVTAAAHGASLLTHDHQKADFRDLLTDPVLENEKRPLRIETVMETAHVDLLRFQTSHSDKAPIYITAPMSGHFSTLVYPVIQNYLDAGHPVYVKDLKDASNVPLKDGPYGMDEQVETEMAFLKKVHEITGQRARHVAICQGGIPATIAGAVLGEQNAPHRPENFVFISGPGDISVTKSVVNTVGESLPDSHYRYNATTFVPFGKPGVWRYVRAGNDQVRDFMLGNPARHMIDHATLFNLITSGQSRWISHTPLTQKELLTALQRNDLEGLERDLLNQLLFRTEYYTSADMAAESYLEAIDGNFKGNFLANGTATYRGTPVDLKYITWPVLTVDAEKDNISSIGQTMGLLAHLPGSQDKRAIIVSGKGHFSWAGGTFHKIYSPQIHEWQQNPANSNIREFTPSMLDEARAIHAENMKKEADKIAAASPPSIRVHGLGFQMAA